MEGNMANLNNYKKNTKVRSARWYIMQNSIISFGIALFAFIFHFSEHYHSKNILSTIIFIVHNEYISLFLALVWILNYLIADCCAILSSIIPYSWLLVLFSFALVVIVWLYLPPIFTMNALLMGIRVLGIHFGQMIK